jgi:hypothetical protein
MVGASFTVAAAAEVIRLKKGITALGNAQVDTAQSKFGGASLLLDGTGDFLQTRNLPNLGTDNFTIECWVRPNSISGIYDGIFTFRHEQDFDLLLDGSTKAPGFVLSTGSMHYYAVDGTSGAVVTYSSSLATGSWQHIALVRNSSNLSVYINGTSVASVSSTAAYNNLGTSSAIGLFDRYIFNGGRLFFNGHIDEFRISNSARYTTTFTPSTTPFVNDANTVLLIHANGTDASTFFEDDNGQVRSQNDGRRNSSAVISTTRSKFGGSSVYLPSDYVTFANAIEFPDNQDFTWEFWVNEDVVQNCKYTGGQTPGDIFIGHDSYGNDTYNNRLAVGVVAVGWYMDFGVTLAADTWYHVCVQRSGDTVYGYTDGTLRVTHTGYLANYPWSWRNLQLSGERDGITVMNGYQDEIRFSNIVRYATAGFTAPTAPFVNDANTVLLIHGDGTNSSTVFRDDNGVRAPNGIAAVGNAQISTAQSKFSGASAVFDGTGDYLTIPYNASISRFHDNTDFTLEYWVRVGNFSNVASGNGINASIVFGNQSFDNFAQYWSFGPIANGNVQFFYYSGSANQYTTSGVTLVTNTWYHLAFVKQTNSLKIYVDGVERGSGTISATPTNGTTSEPITIGAFNNVSFNGYLDEIRVSNVARYTAAFTPSTTPFQSDANTLLLIHANGTNASTVFTDDNGVSPTHSYT